MKPALAVLLAWLFAFPMQAQQSAPAQQQVQVECRDLTATGNYLAPNETIINGKACRAAGTPLQVVESPSKLTPKTPAVAPSTTPAPNNSCLIVTSAEGHRMRNAIIAGVFTGGIGLATGLVASGGRYEYRDAINVPPAQMKMKYKGTELQKLQQQGVHIVVIRKNDKQGESEAIQNGRNACFAPAPSRLQPFNKIISSA